MSLATTPAAVPRDRAGRSSDHEPMIETETAALSPPCTSTCPGGGSVVAGGTDLEEESLS
jgi:hypothetical protein